MRPEADGPDWGHPPSLHRSDADISPATDALRPQQLSAPASITKTQITQHSITVPVAPTVLKTTVAALAQPSLPIESQKSDQTPPLNLHSLTPPPVRTPAAVSSLEAFLTPASVPPLAPAPGRHPKTLNGSSHFRAAESEAISGRVSRRGLDFLSRLFDQPIAKPSNRGLLHGLSCRDRIIRELQRPVHRQRLYQPL